jgi:hypothetical protein
LVAKKKVIATSVSSMEVFPTAGLALQLEVPTAVAIIPDPKVGEESWNYGLDAWHRLRELYTYFRDMKYYKIQDSSANSAY